MQIVLHAWLTSSFDLTSAKDFIVVTSQGGTQCLGKGKGRHYTPMDTKSQKFLEDYYREPNKNLLDLLQQLNKPLPDWLKPSR